MVNVQVKVLQKKAGKGGCFVLLFDTFKELNFSILPALSLYEIEYIKSRYVEGES